MNKYTLKFLSEEKEQEFQSQYNTQTLYPLSTLLFTSGLINSIFRIISGVYISNQWYMIIWIFVFFYFLMQIFITFKYKILTQQILTLTLIILNTIIMFCFSITDQQMLIISTFNITTINAFIIFISDFKHSLIQIASTFSIWTTYIFLQQAVQYMQSPLTFLNVVAVTIVVSYLNCRQFRQKYLLAEQENLWINLIQKVCDNPFQILTFDNINLKYKIENQNNFENQNFIKLTQYENQPLQNYIHQTQSNFSTVNGLLKDETIIVNQKKNNYKIRITYYQIQKIYIAIQLLQDENKIDILRQNNQLIDKKVQEMIQQIIKMLPSAVKSTNNSLKLKLALMEIYFRRQKIELKPFNLNRLIFKHIKAFNQYREQIQFEYDRIINMNGYQNLFSLIFNRILYSKSKIRYIRLTQDEKGYHILFYGDIKLEHDNIIQNCLQIMKTDMEIQKKCIKLTQNDFEYNDYEDFISDSESCLISS